MSAGCEIPSSSGKGERPARWRAVRGGGERGFLASLIRDVSRPVLEIGAGACACLTLVLAKRGLRILAIDRDADAVKKARRTIPGTRLRRQVVLAQADAARLPFQSGSIRTVVAYNALHHADDVRAPVAEVARVLHATGRLIISDWDEAKDGYLDRLDRALRARFRRVTVLPRCGRRVYIAEEPRGATRTARGNASVRRPARAAAV